MYRVHDICKTISVSALKCLVAGSGPGVARSKKVFSLFFDFVVWGQYFEFLVAGSIPGVGRVEKSLFLHIFNFLVGGEYVESLCAKGICA